jgi:hypothetical protein
MKVPVFSYFVQIVYVIPFDPFSNHVYVVVQDEIKSLFLFFRFIFLPFNLSSLIRRLHGAFLFKICQETFHFSRSYKVISMLTGRCHFLTKIIDYDQIGSLRIMTQRNGKLRLKNERFDWLLFQSFDFCHNKEVRF